MIPQADIVAWRQVAPWGDDGMVEQDLVLSRALVEIFLDPMLAAEFAFRGGTALHKLVLLPRADTLRTSTWSRFSLARSGISSTR